MKNLSMALLAVCLCVFPCKSQNTTDPFTPREVQEGLSGGNAPVDPTGNPTNPLTSDPGKRGAMGCAFEFLKCLINALDAEEEWDCGDEVAALRFHLIFRFLDGEIVSTPFASGGDSIVAVTLPSGVIKDPGGNTVGAYIGTDPEFGGGDTHRVTVLDDNDFFTSGGETNFGPKDRDGKVPKPYNKRSISCGMLGLVLLLETCNATNPNPGSTSSKKESECLAADNELPCIEKLLEIVDFLGNNPECFGLPGDNDVGKALQIMKDDLNAVKESHEKNKKKHNC